MLRSVTILFLMILNFEVHAQNAKNALDFDGLDDFISLKLDTIFRPVGSSDFTIEFWMLPRENDPVANILSFYNDQWNSTSIGITKNYNLFYWVHDSYTYTGSSVPQPVASNVWIHVAMTYAIANKEILFYINGIKQSKGTNPGYPLQNGPIGYLGSFQNVTSNYFNGKLDEFRVWNVVRTQCEIASNMHTTLTGSETNLVQYFNFNHGTAAGSNPNDTILVDSAGLRKGILHNFNLSSTSSNWISSGALLNKSGLQPDISYFKKDTVTICRGSRVKFHDGHTVFNITNDSLYLSELKTKYKCDSTFETTVIVERLDTSITMVGDTLKPGFSSAFHYQWLNCDSGFAILPGANSNFYLPKKSGSYAVQLTDGECRDTTDCITFSINGIDDFSHAQMVRIIPNPNSGDFQIHLGTYCDKVTVLITEISGKKVFEITFKATEFVRIDENFRSGIYFLNLIIDQSKTLRKRVIID